MNRQSPAAQVRPHRVRQWLHSHDPQFRETAALDVHSGRVLARCTDRRTQDDLVALMEEVARAHPTGRVHVVWDNLNTHRAYAYGRTSTPGTAGASSVTSRPCTPAGFNQIELLFAIYARRVLRHASHTSIAYLRQRTQDFIAQRNRSPKPFKWTFAGLELQTGEPRRFAPHAHTLRSRAAAELRGHLAKLIGHDYARVRAYGKHLLIQMRRKDAVDTVARLTEVARNRYTAASQPHRALGAIADCRRSGARCRRSHDSYCAVP